ncbi:MAG: DMT family transporter [Treponema sp.]|jgi:drug/metabolite transporter (DMT)-like permease|nr:DMT family transporter [Treponema sp.]
MNKQALRADILLLITAAIWGFAFTAQRSGMEYMGPFTFNGIRFLMGSLSLIPFVLFRMGNPANALAPKTAALASLLAGSCLFIAVSLQQIGLMYTTAGNSGFITGLYVAFTPIFGLFLGKKTGLPTWIGAGFALTGMFFLSAAEPLLHAGSNGKTINPGDLITAVSAFFWTFHVLIIDALAKRIDPVTLASGQFACCGLFSLAAVLALRLAVTSPANGAAAGLAPALYRLAETEAFSLASLRAGLIPLLYGGLFSAGIAYTLQVAAQKYAPPAHATILLSLEGVFAVIGGALLLREPLGTWTLLGFILMFCGMLTTQWDVILGRRR